MSTVPIRIGFVANGSGVVCKTHSLNARSGRPSRDSDHAKCGGVYVLDSVLVESGYIGAHFEQCYGMRLRTWLWTYQVHTLSQRGHRRPLSKKLDRKFLSISVSGLERWKRKTLNAIFSATAEDVNVVFVAFDEAHSCQARIWICWYWDSPLGVGSGKTKKIADWRTRLRPMSNFTGSFQKLREIEQGTKIWNITIYFFCKIDFNILRFFLFPVTHWSLNRFQLRFGILCKKNPSFSAISFLGSRWTPFSDFREDLVEVYKFFSHTLLPTGY